MYNFDGMWYRVVTCDVLIVISGIFFTIFGVKSWRSEKKKPLDSMLVAGILSLIFGICFVTWDVAHILDPKVIVERGVLRNVYSDCRGGKWFTNRYVFAFDGKLKKEGVYIDIFTLKAMMGEDFEFEEGSRYEISYEDKMKIILMIKEI